MMKKVIFYILLLSCLPLGQLSAQMFGQNPRVKINKGSRYTRTTLVSVQIAGFDVAKMKISNFIDFREAFWIPYTPRVYGWKLRPSDNKDGKCTVYVKFKLRNGDFSETITDDIILDTQKPTGTKVSIEAGEHKALSSANETVELKLEWNKARYVKLSNSSRFYRRRWQIATDVVPDWTLKGDLDGKRIVFAKFRDAAGNISDVVYDKVHIDSQAPVRQAVVINKGEEVSTDSLGNVSLELTAVGAFQMLISNNKDFADADWQKFQAKIMWKLPAGDGNHIVYAKFKDKASNLTEVVFDDISVDATAPLEGNIIINEGDEVSRQIDGIIELSIKASDADMMLISNNKNFKGARWQPYDDLVTDWRIIGSNGKKRVYIKFRDDAGNVSPMYSDDIILVR